MSLNQISNEFLSKVIVFCHHWLIPCMVGLFVASILARCLIYFTIRREEWFSHEFERRVDNFIAEFDAYKGVKSFFVMSKKLLEKTYYELFEVRSYMKRRKPDFVMAPADRIFLIKQGTAWFVHDVLKQMKWLRKDANHATKLPEIARKTFQYNPCFSRIFGVIPIGIVHDAVTILPGTFIVLGIFGMFLGIVQGLPELSLMDLTDPAGTKQIMDNFILKMAFSMNTSIIGIMFSLTLHYVNLFMNPSKVFVRTVDRFEACLEKLWELSENNQQPQDLPAFDEHRDPLEALAEESLQKGLGKNAPVKAA